MYGSISYGMVPAAGSAADPLELVTTRTLLEVLGAYDDIELLTSRSVLEVIGDSPYIPPDIRPSVTRAVLEVIGSLASASTKQTRLTRAVLEVLASAKAEVQELVAPGLQGALGTAFSLFLALGPGDLTAGRSLGFVSPSGEGLTVSSDGANLLLALRSGYGEATVLLPSFPNGLVLTVQADSDPASTIIRTNGVPLALSSSSGTFDPWTMDRLSGDAGVFGEVVVFGSVVGDPIRTEVEDYLRVKWA